MDAIVPADTLDAGTYVSIHAPVMDAIKIGLKVRPPDTVSIHAPVMDAMPRSAWHWHTNCFNPRARDGRDHYKDSSGIECIVSIHAPVMDAILSAMLYCLP